MADASRVRGIELGAAAFAWTVWCILSSAPLYFIANVAAIALQRPALAEDAVMAIVVETLVLGISAFAVFRGLERLDPPAWYWAVAPAGFIVAFVVDLAVSRIAGATTVIVGLGSVAELAAVCAVTAAGGYLGGMRRAARAARGAVPDGDPEAEG